MPAVTSFSTWTLVGLSWDTLGFRAGADKDVVDATRGNGVVKDGPFTARMGAGQDTIYARSRDTGPFNGGPGEDMLFVQAKGTTQQGGKTIAADLGSDTFKLTGYDVVRIASIENLSLSYADGARAWSATGAPTGWRPSAAATSSTAWRVTTASRARSTRTASTPRVSASSPTAATATTTYAAASTATA